MGDTQIQQQISGDLTLVLHTCVSYASPTLGKTTVTEQPGYFVYERGRWQGKKRRKNFWGGVCEKWGIVLFGVKSILKK